LRLLFPPRKGCCDAATSAAWRRIIQEGKADIQQQLEDAKKDVKKDVDKRTFCR